MITPYYFPSHINKDSRDIPVPLFVRKPTGDPKEVATELLQENSDFKFYIEQRTPEQMKISAMRFREELVRKRVLPAE